MILTIFFTLCYAKYKKLNISPLFRCIWLLPLLLLEVVHLIFQCAVLQHNYMFVPYAAILKRLYLYAMLVPILRYGLYQSALFGSILLVFGTMLNRIAMYANGGRMPVYPSISKWTGYFNASVFNSYDQIHMLETAETKFKLLTDYIDLGFSILSPGDLLVHSFTFIILYDTIKKLQVHQNKNN